MLTYCSHFFSLVISKWKLLVSGSVYPCWLAFVQEIWSCFWGENACYLLEVIFIFWICSWGSKIFHVQAFKIVVTDPDTVLNSLTREVKELGPDGQEVSVLFVRYYCTHFFSMTKVTFYLICQVTKVVPAITDDVKESLVRNIRRRMTPQPLKIRADIEMKCFQFDGVLHIKVFFFLSFLDGCLFKLQRAILFTCFNLWPCRMPCGKLKLLGMMTVLWKLNWLLLHFMFLPLRLLTRFVQTLAQYLFDDLFLMLYTNERNLVVFKLVS